MGMTKGRRKRYKAALADKRAKAKRLPMPSGPEESLVDIFDPSNPAPSLAERMEKVQRFMEGKG